ncbi:hypothetical protein Tco_1095318 [Tanacetum coccineum]
MTSELPFEGGVLLGPERPRTYEGPCDRRRKYDADVRATISVLQGSSQRYLQVINHNIEAKRIFGTTSKWLMAGYDLIKEDSEYQLLRWSLSRIQMLQCENINGLYAYLKQHEKHAAQDRLIIERITPATNDQLAFVSTVQPHAQSSHVQSHQYPSSSTNPQSLQYPQFPETSQIDSGYTQTDEILDNLTKQMALLAQSFRATLPQTNNQLRTSSNTRNQATIQDGRVVVQNVQGRQNQNQNQRYVARGNGAAGNGGHRIELGMPMQPKRPQNSDYFKDKMLLMQAQENGAVLDEEELLFLAGEQGNTFDADVDNQPVQDLALNEDNIFQADECDAFDSDVDDEPTAQTIFMANLSSAGSANPQAGPSNASILSEVHTLENAIDHIVTNEVQQSNVIDSTSVYMGNSNVIPYEQYLSVNNISVVPSCASSTLNNVCVSSDNDAFVPHDPIANELKIYKEQVAIYEQRAKFELTEREQRMDDQMRMLIQNRNKTEENLKKELHSVKLQLNSTMENNKIIEGTVTTLKQELKQKESKFLTDFSNLKHLNDKLENKLHSQDQSIQTVHMMLNPTQPHHVPVIVPSSEGELELAETTRNKLHVKMNDSACVEKRVNITPPNYSKQNFMATFTPQTQLTPEQVFWSLDLAKRKAEELKANAPPLSVLPPATVYPPNTPIHLVPRTLPTTSQVNIGLYVITQLF